MSHVGWWIIHTACVNDTIYACQTELVVSPARRRLGQWVGSDGPFTSPLWRPRLLSQVAQECENSSLPARSRLEEVATRDLRPSITRPQRFLTAACTVEFFFFAYRCMFTKIRYKLCNRSVRSSREEDSWTIYEEPRAQGLGAALGNVSSSGTGHILYNCVMSRVFAGALRT